MAYCKGKSIEKQRGNAIKELVLEKRSIAQIARRYRRSRSTIYRWKKKWNHQQTVILKNTNRPSRPLGNKFRWANVKWDVPTIYTVIDLYSRMAYAKVSPNLREKVAAMAIFEAENYMDTKFKMVQSDNGAEFQNHFAQRLNHNGMHTRHSRVRHPNDDAHIERFNRTLRKECIGQYNSNKKIDYINYYNYNRIHLGLGLKTPNEVLQRC